VPMYAAGTPQSLPVLLVLRHQCSDIDRLHTGTKATWLCVVEEGVCVELKWKKFGVECLHG
jgi:hypothetical protein